MAAGTALVVGFAGSLGKEALAVVLDTGTALAALDTQ